MDAGGWFGSGAAGNAADLLPAGPCAASFGQSEMVAMLHLV